MSTSDPRQRFLLRYAGGFAPVVIARAEGAWIETTDGLRILDFTSGQICSTLGHNHPRIVAAIRTALADVMHLNSWMLSEPVLALGERLANVFPEPLRKVLLLNTGSEANEAALKLAKMATGRFEVVGLTRSFHGLLAGVSSVNYSMGHSGYGPLLPGAFAIPAPYAYRCPVRHCDGVCDCTCLDVGFELVDQQSVGSLCALIAEPVLSAGGVIVPPEGYFRRVREHLDERGMLLVMDEAQTGLGRLGAMFGFEQDAVTPDVVVALEDARWRSAARCHGHERVHRNGVRLQRVPPRHLARLGSPAGGRRACRSRRDPGGRAGRAGSRAG